MIKLLIKSHLTPFVALLFFLINIFLVSFCNADERLSQEEFDKWNFSSEQVKRCGVSNMLANNDCINHEFKTSNAELNRLYKLLVKNLISPKLLKESQLAWVKFRDKTCAYEISGLSEDGSLPFYQKTACLINLTEKRILDLKMYLSWTYDGSPPRKP
ncbi:MAG: lysozyme inhibitor LprI family protein [Methylotenera sp.]